MRQRYRLRLKIAIWVSSASTRAAVNTYINNGYYFSLCLVWSAQHTQCNTEIIRDPLTVSFSSGITRAYHINKEVYKYSVHLNTSCYYTYYYFSSFVVVYSSSPLLFWPPLLPLLGSLLLPQRAIIIIMTIVYVTFILFSFVNCCRCRRGTAYNILCFTMPDPIYVVVFFSKTKRTERKTLHRINTRNWSLS